MALRYPWLAEDQQNICATCGVCCLAFHVVYEGGDLGVVDPRFEEKFDRPWAFQRALRAVETGRLVPLSLAREEPERRCVFLAGTPGKQVYCTHHTPRAVPIVCSQFLPGCQSCNQLREGYGLSQLPSAPLKAHVGFPWYEETRWARESQLPFGVGTVGGLVSPREPGLADWILWLRRALPAQRFLYEEVCRRLSSKRRSILQRLLGKSRYRWIADRLRPRPRLSELFAESLDKKVVCEVRIATTDTRREA